MMRYTKNLSRIGLFCFLIFSLLSLYGCGKKSTKPEKSAQEFAAEGWSLFESEDYTGAKSKFSEALAKDGDYADAYNGRGWCNAFLDLDGEAVSDLNAANTKGLGKPDAYAGLAGVYVGNQEFASALDKARIALSMDSTYQFSHQTAINYMDLHLIKAQAYYGLGGAYLDSAQQEVNYLNPFNGLDPAESSSWVVNGIIYNSYAEALLKEIQRLEESIGGY
jgi:tetratricopeptide (TPR) repeat protein